MKSDDEDFPVSYLLYVVAALAAITAVAIGGFILWLRLPLPGTMFGMP